MQLKPAMHWMLLNVLLVKPNEDPAPTNFFLFMIMILYDKFYICPFAILGFFFSKSSFDIKVKFLLMSCFVQSLLPQEEAVIFVVSTTGQGDAPDSMKVT